MASNSKNLAELLNSDVTLTATDIANGAVTLDKLAAATKASLGGGKKNLIINGDMNIAQRSTSSTGLGATTGYYTADRWEHQFNATAGRLTSSVVGITDLAGFRSALKFECTTADTSIAASEYFVLAQKIEGFNIQDVGFGTASAKPLTLSFYVKGNGNATYTAQLQTGFSNEVSASFNVTSSWQRIEINYPAATSVGSVLNNDNSAQLMLQIWLHAGSDFSGGSSLNTTWGSPNNNTMAVGNSSFFSSTSNEFFITGVQLETGTVATDFGYRSIGEELQLCQRYYEISRESKTQFGGGGMTGYSYHVANGSGAGTTAREGDPMFFKVSKRSSPTVTPYSYSGTANAYSGINGGGTSTNYNIRKNTFCFNMYRSTYGSFNGWFDWEADAEL